MKTRTTIAAGVIGLVLVGGGIGIGIAASRGGGGGTLPPAVVLQQDGYPTFMTLTADQLREFAPTAPDLDPYIITVVYGAKTGSQEMVVQLTDEGARLVTPRLNEMNTGGTTAHMDGNNLTLNMPFSG